jgi:hypothetical protein
MRHVEGRLRFDALLPLTRDAPPELMARALRVFGGVCDIGVTSTGPNSDTQRASRSMSSATSGDRCT